MARDIARNAAAAVLLIAGASAMGGAQPRMNRGPNADAPRLMVSACRTTDKALAVQCGDKIRTQVEGDVSFRALYVNPKSDVENTLTASGYDPAMALAPADAIALAKNIRADMYIDASIEKVGAGFKLTAAVVLARDANLVQPLGTYENARLDGAVQAVSKAFQDAFNKTFTSQKECFTLARERKIAEANKRIADGLRDYPKSTWLRHCQLGILKDQRAPATQVLKAAEELRDLDPANKTILRELVIMYDAMGEREKKVATLEQLRAADPSDARLTADIINELAAMRNFEKALPIAQQAVAANPGDINIIRPYWLILTAQKQYKDAIAVGKQMATLDSATADTVYFNKMVAAAVADSNFAEAADLSLKAARKFPKVTDYWTYGVTFYRRAGDTTRSLAMAGEALKANPKLPGMRAQIAQAILERKTEAAADSAVVLVKQMIADGEDKLLIAGIAVKAGDVLRQLPDQIKPAGPDSAAQVVAKQAAWMKAYNELAWADTLAKGTSVTDQAKFLMGVAALSVGQGYLTNASDVVRRVADEVKARKPDAAAQRAMYERVYPEACTLTNKANDYFVVAQIALPAGARFAPDATRQVMGSLMQMNTYVEQMTKNYCRSATSKPADVTARSKP